MFFYDWCGIRDDKLSLYSALMDVTTILIVPYYKWLSNIMSCDVSGDTVCMFTYTRSLATTATIKTVLTKLKRLSIIHFLIKISFQVQSTGLCRYCYCLFEHTYVLSVDLSALTSRTCNDQGKSV